MQYPSDIMEEVLFTEDQIRARAKELAKQISKDYANKDLVIVCTLKGATLFFGDLVKNIDINCNLEFIKASSYIGNTTMTIGNVQISKVMTFDIEGKDILIIEDIVDTGLTYESLHKYFSEKKCASINICTLLDKPSRRQVSVEVKYIGFEIEDKFVIGYGLDYNEAYRNIPCVGVINKKYI